MAIYDLSHIIATDTPIYPGDARVEIERAGEFAKDGFTDHVVTLNTHVGTHIDAPAHMIEDGKELKEYEIGRLAGLRAVCIDATQGFDPAQVAKLVAQPDMAVLFFTGASEYFYDDKYWQDYMVLNDETIQVLIEKQVGMIGLDTGSADNADGFPVHKKLLSEDILIIENLANLKPLIGKTFDLYALPLKLEVEAAPARVIARL